MKSRAFFCQFLILLFPVMVFGYGVEQNAGLRAAEEISPTDIKLYIGPGFGDYQFAKKLLHFR